MICACIHEGTLPGTYLYICMWYGMKANCPPDQAGGLINPEASIVVPGIWIMSHGSVPVRREDIGACSLTIRHGLSWICVQFRENAAAMGTLNSFRKCGRDIWDIFLILSQHCRHTNTRDIKVGNVDSIRVLSRKCVCWRLLQSKWRLEQKSTKP